MAVGKRQRLKFDGDKQITKPTRYYSSRQEKNVAKLVGGQQVKNSGATDFAKGDVTSDYFLIECKTHTADKDSMSIKKAWIDKNLEESLFMGKKYSALAFNFGPSSKNYYVIDEYLMRLLLEKIEEIENDQYI